MTFTYLNSITNNTNKTTTLKPGPIFNTVASVSGTGYEGIAISKNGKYMLVCKPGASGTVYLSSNFGVSFTSISTFNTLSNRACGISNDGQYMVVVVNNGYMYKSSDYGANWSQVTSISTTQNWIAVALSANGNYCIAVGANPTVNAYISSNFSSLATFTPKSIFTFTGGNTGSVAISETGQYIITTANSGTPNKIGISKDYGETFTIVNISGFIGTVSISYDGTIAYATVNNVGLYKSTNISSATPTFQQITSPTFTEQSWWGVAIGTNGYVVASTNAKVYYTYDFGNTWILNKTTLLYQIRISGDNKKCIGRGNDVQISSL
jgi:hypothetical protein